MEARRIATSKPTTHEYVGFERVYCPEFDQVRPAWLCAMEHGDYHEVLDTED